MLENDQLRVGDNIDAGPLYEQLTNMINAVAMTSEQAQELLAAMGFDAEVEEVTDKQEKKDKYLEPAQYGPGESLPYGVDGEQSFHTVQLLSKAR